MRYTSLVILSLILFGFNKESVAQTKKYNLSYEKGLNDWIINDVNQNTVYGIDSSLVYDGHYSLRIIPDKQGIFAAGTYVYLMNQPGSLKISYMLHRSRQDSAQDIPSIFIQKSEREIKQDTPLLVQAEKEWSRYSSTFNIKEQDLLAVGIIYSGVSTINIDDVRITLNGVDVANLKSSLFPNIFNDHEFDQSSKVDKIRLTSSIKSRLFYLSKIWGLLKYYHPLVTSGKINWDYELFRILPLVLEMRNDFNQTMSRWIDELGEIQQIEHKTIIPEDYVLFDWIDDKKIGKELSEKLRYIIENSNNKFSYYVSFNGNVNPVFENEYSFPNIKNDCGYRLLALFRAWNIVEYFFPYKHLTDKNWNNVLKEYISVFVTAVDTIKYRKCLMQFTTELCDSHAGVYHNGRELYDIFGLDQGRSLSVFARALHNKCTVTNVVEGRNSPFLPGDIIIRVNNHRIKRLVRKYEPYFPSSNKQGKHNSIYNKILQNCLEDSVMVKWKSGKIMSHRFVKTANSQYYSSKLGKGYEIIDNNIGYINVGYFDVGSLDSLMKKFKTFPGIIFDMRVYPKSFMVYKIGTCLLPNDKNFVLFKQTSISRPGIYNSEEIGKIGITNLDYYKGKVVLIVNNSTFSQGEFTTMGWSMAPNSIIIGEQTKGADGNVTGFYLPENFYITLSGCGIYYPDGGATQRQGIRIDEIVEPSLEGIREGRDELLERAIRIIKE